MGGRGTSSMSSKKSKSNSMLSEINKASRDISTMFNAHSMNSRGQQEAIEVNTKISDSLKVLRTKVYESSLDNKKSLLKQIDTLYRANDSARTSIKERTDSNKSVIQLRDGLKSLYDQLK